MSKMLDSNISHWVVQAIIREDLEALQNFYDAGVNFNQIFDQTDQPLLTVAMEYNKPESFNFLINVGVDLEIPSAQGETPLNYAASEGMGEYVERLVLAGANVNTQDDWGLTPLNSAAAFMHYDIVQYFLTLPQVNVNLPDIYGEAPLAWMYVDSEWEIMEALFRHPQYDVNFNYLLLEELRLIDSLEYVVSHGPEFDQSLIEFYEETKLFSLKFDIGGCFIPATLGQDSFCFSLEGYDNPTGLDKIALAFQPFYNHVIVEEGIPEWVKVSFSIVQESLAFSQHTTDPHAYYHKILAGDPVFIPSGWDEHSIVFVIQEDHLYRCNRGHLSDGTHGIEEFIITRSDNLTPALIDVMLQASGEPDYLQEEIIDYLGLQKIGEVENPTQLVGNCVWTSQETGVEALFITTFMSLGIDSESAHYLAKETFSLWENYDLNLTLATTIAHSEIYIENEIYEELLLEVIKAHHHSDDLNEVQRGAFILSQLDDPPGLEILDPEYTDFFVACDTYQSNHLEEISLDYNQWIEQSLDQSLYYLFNNAEGIYLL